MTDINIRVVDTTEIGDPQVLAMLQAFYSRSPMSIDKRIDSLTKDGDGETAADKIRNAIKRYYVDYGHASIGECGGATVFVEGISMLAAKAIQDHPLYVGQECSTRYIDFAHQPIITSSTEDQKVAESFKQLYLETLPVAYEYALRRFPAELVVSSKIAPDQVKAAHERTCKAIAFDFCRGLLPAGATTSVAWTANFRVFNDHLRFLAEHPLDEVRHLAAHIYEQLSSRYGSSFKQESLYRARGPVDLYYNTETVDFDPHLSSVWVPDEKDFVRSFFNGKPTKYGRHRSDNAIYFRIKGSLDFGSYRDLQRHRNGQNQMPLLTPTLGMHSYYQSAFEEMGNHIVEKLYQIEEQLKQLKSAPEYLQYAVPMGMKVPTKLTWSLGQLRYVMNLRTKTTVHPTLRDYLFDVYASFDYQSQYPGLLDIAQECLTIDNSPHYAASDRGEQTIKERPSGTTNG